MEYTFTDKRYCISFVNEQGDVKKLVYRIVDTPIAALWIGRVRRVKSKPNCYVFGNQWATYIPSLEKIDALWQKMKRLVDETNSGKYIQVGFIDMPDEFDPHVDQQELLNFLHYTFHKFEEEAATQVKTYDPLMQLNVEIHKLEQLVKTYKLNQTQDKSLLACGFFLTDGHMDKIAIPSELYLPWWNHSAQFGDMVLGYHTVGKNIQHCYQDNDVELIKSGFLRPQKELGNEVLLMFPATYHPNSANKVALAIKQWVADNQLESYVDMSLPENQVSAQPLIGRIEGEYTRQEISDLFENYKVADAELFECDTVTFGLYNQLLHRSAEFQDHIKFITEFSFNAEVGAFKPAILRKPYDIVESTSIDELLVQADQAKSDYLYFVAYGHRSVNLSLPTMMIKYAEQNNYAVLGHILQDNPTNPSEGFYSMHHQAVLINMNHWRSAGCPPWGNYQQVVNMTLPQIKRSEENAHDDYTPHWIEPQEGQQVYSGVLREGWNLIASMISSGKKIGNFPTEIRKFKSFLYPDAGDHFERFLRGEQVELPDWNQNRYASFTQFTPVQSSVFVFNTDRMNEEPMQFDRNTQLDSIYCVAAGFKPLQLLKRCGWHSGTRMVYFDYSQAALDFKKWLLIYWNGCNYIQAIERYKDTVDPTFKPIWFFGQSFDPVWTETINIFGGETQWLEFWNQYKLLPHEFIKTNLFDDRSALLDDMRENPGNKLIWFSNSFNTEAAVRHFNRPTLSGMYNDFIADLTAVNDSQIQVCGSDWLGKKEWFTIKKDQV